MPCLLDIIPPPLLPALAVVEVLSSPQDLCSHFLSGLPNTNLKPWAALGWEDGFQHTLTNDLLKNVLVLYLSLRDLPLPQGPD